MNKFIKKDSVFEVEQQSQVESVMLRKRSSFFFLSFMLIPLPVNSMDTEQKSTMADNITKYDKEAAGFIKKYSRKKQKIYQRI